MAYMKKLMVDLEVNGITLTAETDSACPILMINEITYNNFFNFCTLSTSDLQFNDASLNEMATVGRFPATIRINERVGQLDVYVSRNGPANPLLGRQALDIGFPGWRKTFVNINKLDSNLDFKHQALIAEFPKVFDNDFSKPISGITVGLKLKQEAKPVYLRARTVPFKIAERYRTQLELMCQQGILTKVEFSKWASPTVSGLTFLGAKIWERQLSKRAAVPANQTA